MNSYVQLAISAFLPTILTIIFILLEKKTTFFNKIPYIARQIIFGVSFGILAVIGTEWGIPFNGAMVNSRDAAAVTAGLMFGAPAGIIAGLIGGVERYFAVYWGVGTYTRIACTVSTIAAGVYSALLRKYLFDDKRPSFGLAFAIGLVIEVFHMTMVFVTHLDDTTHAAEVVKTCSLLMIPANSLGTMLPALSNNLFFKDKTDNKNVIPTISQTIQKWLLFSVIVVFVVTSLFIYGLQTSIAERQAEDYLKLAIEDVVSQVTNASDENMIDLCYKVKKIIDTKPIYDIANELDIVEINVVNEKGFISNSTNASFIGFDMSDGEQSQPFMQLLKDETEYVQEYGPISYNQSIYRKYAGIKYKKGFIQIGFDSAHIQKQIASEVRNAAVNRHVGNTGYIIIADENYWVVSQPKDKNIISLNDFYEAGDYSKEEFFFKANIEGVDVVCYCVNADGFYVVSVMPTEEMYSLRDTALYANTFMEVLVFGLLFIMVYVLIKEIIVNRINKVNKSLSKITDGDLEEVVDVRSNEEFNSLSNDINSTVDTLKRYIAEASARIDAELEYAKNIQSSALPHTFPKDDRFELFALMQPAKEVGGDFYDFARIGHDTFNFLVADVSGKSIPGAMFMMRAKSTLGAFTEMHLDVNDIFTQGNERLCEGNDAGMFVTSWEASLDLRSGHIDYANAGHNPPVVRRVDGTCEFIKGKPGFVLAGMEGVQYKKQEVDLQPGDIIFLYTDGVVEATNANSELYGDDRLLRTMVNAKFETMQELCDLIMKDIELFVGDAEQFDDITMLALKYLGNNE